MKNSLGDELLTVIAFGSRIRGDFRDDSDFDVLILVKRRDKDTIAKIVNIFTNEELKIGIPFCPVVKSWEIFSMEKKFRTGFFRNIINVGKVLYGKTL